MVRHAALPLVKLDVLGTPVTLSEREAEELRDVAARDWWEAAAEQLECSGLAVVARDDRVGACRVPLHQAHVRWG
jgi:hypothetical protein